MDFSTIRSQVSQLINLDESANDLTTIYNRWINETYKRLAADANWPWLIKHDIVQTVTEISTGTVAITSGDTALTFSSGPTPSVTTANGYRIQLEGADDWYDISAHTAGATSATLADNFLRDTLTTGTYVLRKWFYSLPSDIDRIIVVTEANDNTPLEYLDHRELKKTFPDIETDGTPNTYTIEGLDSSNNWRTRFFPTPDTTINIDFWYYQTITELSADGDTPIFPSKWHEILIWGVLSWYGFLFRDDPVRQGLATSNYNKLLKSMKASLIPTTDEITQISPFDTRRPLGGRKRLATPVLPGDYGHNFR